MNSPVLGIIAEFNPYHKGHSYLIREAKKRLGGNAPVIICMSGNFMQRGEPAVFDKYVRATSCLEDADIIAEMPVIFATSGAGDFAECGVRILSRLGITHLAFGAEYADDDTLEMIKKAVHILSDEPHDYKEIFRELLAEGLSYPSARSRALYEYCGIPEHIISSPNNILMTEYLTSIYRNSLPIEPVIIKRSSDNYHDTLLPDSENELASATSIRSAMTEGLDISKHMTEAAFKAVSPYITTRPVTADALLPYIMAPLIMNMEGVSKIADMSDDIYRRLLNRKAEGCSYTELTDYLKKRNVTMTHVKRLLLHIALGISEADRKLVKESGFVSYANLLAMKKTASPILRDAAERIDIITKKAGYKPEPGSTAAISWEADKRATLLYNQLMFSTSGIRLKPEPSTTPVII